MGQVETLALQIQETEREHRAAEADIDQCVREHAARKRNCCITNARSKRPATTYRRSGISLRALQAIQEAALGRRTLTQVSG